MSTFFKTLLLLAIPSWLTAQVAVQNNGILYVSYRLRYSRNRVIYQYIGRCTYNNGMLYIARTSVTASHQWQPLVQNLTLNGLSFMTISGTNI